MKENTNSAIAVNSAILYIRLGLVTIFGLFTTRFALKALGVNDFGLFSVIGGIISFIVIINTIMLSVSNRFIAVAIGKGEPEKINEAFNVNLFVHICIAFFTIIVLLPIGDWYINNYLNFNGDIALARDVYHITIIGSIISFIGIPYNGYLIARERFIVFCLTDALCHLLKMIGAYLLINHFDNKIIVYAGIISFLTFLPTIIYIFYCSLKYKKDVKPHFVRDWNRYKEVLGFSVWVGYGAIASVGKSQGAAIIVNKFFSTVMNTALGISNTVYSLVHVVTQNVGKSISPQIVKSYSSGNEKRAEKLVVMSSKCSFIVAFIIASPILIETEFILHLWLGNVPDYAVIFTRLLIIDSLIHSLSSGITELVFAIGKIKWFQIIQNTIILFSIVIGYFVLKLGFPAYDLIVTYIIFELIVLVINQVLLNRIFDFDNWSFIKGSTIPSFTILIIFASSYFIYGEMNPLLGIFVSLIIAVVLSVLIGFNRAERQLIIDLIKKLLKVK